MTKLILFRLPRNEQSRLPEREPEPESKSEPALSEEEVEKERRMREFELENEAAIVNYFAHRLNESQHQYSGPLNLKQFYIDQAIQSLPQLKFNRNLLTCMISTGMTH